MSVSNLQLSKTELKMFEEVFQVLSKYSSNTRPFGLQLVHTHFPLREGEILYETHDAQARTIAVRPVPAGKIKKRTLATAWQMASTGQIEVAMFCCDESDGAAEV